MTFNYTDNNKHSKINSNLEQGDFCVRQLEQTASSFSICQSEYEGGQLKTTENNTQNQNEQSTIVPVKPEKYPGERISESTMFESILDILHDSGIPAIRSVDNRRPLSHAKLRRFVADFYIPVSGLSQSSRIGVLLAESPELAVCLVAVMASCCVVPINNTLTNTEVVSEVQFLNVGVVIVENSRKQDELMLRLLQAGVSVVLLKPDNGCCGLQQKTPVSRVSSSSSMYPEKSPPRQKSFMSFILPDIHTKTSVSHVSSSTTTSINFGSPITTRQRSIVSFLLPDTRKYSKPNETIMILRTSGTSGSKKTVSYTLKTLIVGAKCLAESWKLVAGTDINLNMMPLYHVGGIVRNLLAPIVSKSTVIITAGFDARTFWEILQNHSPTWYYAVPTMHMAILENAPLRPQPPSPTLCTNNARTSLRMIVNAGGGIPHSLAVKLRTRFYNCDVLPSYGMTECMPIASPPMGYALEKPGCSGVSVGPEIAIMSPIGKVLGAGEFGRIVIRGAPMFQGYENDDHANKEAFTTDGFFDTGDIGYMDDDNYLFITGRSKEIINRGGETISPVEIEDIVMQHPKVKSVLAFSVPHNTLQETIGVVIVTKEKQLRLGLSELQRFVSENLNFTKWPQLIVFMDELPKNQANKLLRIKLSERLAIGEISDTTPILNRIFEAECPRNNTSLETPIKCQSVTRISVKALQELLNDMPYKKDVFVFSETAENIAVLISGHPIMSKDLVRQYLEDKLHEYEIPQNIIVLPDIPKMLESSKIDVEACLVAFEDAMQEDLTQIESIILHLFVEVLGLAKVPRKTDDFFELGGSSLAVGKVLSLIRSRYGVKLKPIMLVRTRTATTFASAISENPEDSKRLIYGSQETLLNEFESSKNTKIGTTNSKSPTSVLALVVQLIPLLIIRPLRISCVYLLFAHYVCLLSDGIFRLFNEKETRGTFSGSVVIIFHLALALIMTGATFKIVDPIVVIFSKWIIIGKYKAGSYPLWGSYYLRWWIVDQIQLIFSQGIFLASESTRILYFRILGARIGWNVHIHPDTKISEFDLMNIYPDCIIVNSELRAFTMAPGLMILKPVILGIKE
ncbi:hypothetical protein HK100_005757 [Physocladia obscura]|uniref:Carrier domain-containing protein n=1 Tax=Physocladia obscura TaxID=109957 RepID=A0AAD5T7G2_9FUNG|nr:hypothetical protein HK100_005757 [Physocladia obscura]